MNKIEQIRERLQFLPNKDPILANTFLNKRDFISLKELVDSAVQKISNKRFRLEASNTSLEPTDDMVKFEDLYNELKTLQEDVNEQARAFEPELSDEEFYCPEDYD